MATESIARDRLQPALLDRITDLAPTERAVEAPELRTITRARLRQLVLRDLNWLLNAPRGLDEDELQRFSTIASSTVNFGIAPLTGKLASGIELYELELLLRQAIVNFEPRILPDSLVVRGIVSETLLDMHNLVSFEITGRLWAQPYPIELLLRTNVDLETGAAQVMEATQSQRSEG